MEKGRKKRCPVKGHEVRRKEPKVNERMKEKKEDGREGKRREEGKEKGCFSRR